MLKLSKEKYSDILLFAILLTATSFLSADWFMVHDFLPRNYAFILISVVWTICCFLTTSKSRLSLDAVTVAVSLLLFYLLIRSLSLSVKIQIFYFVAAGLLYFLFRYKDIPSRVFNFIIAIACVAQALYGLLQFCGLIPITSYFPVSGSFDNPAGFSVSMMAGFPFLLNLTVASKKRLWGIIACLIVIGIVILSQSRTGFFALVIVGIVFMITRYRNNLRRYWKMAIGLIIILVVSIFVLLLFIKPGSTSGRVFIWKVAAGLCLNNPIIGSGIGSFNVDYMEAQACYFQTNQDNGYELLADVITHPFNEFLLLFIQFGLVGIILLFLLCFALWKTREPINSPYMLGLIVIIIHSCFSYPLRYSFTWSILIYCISQIAKSAPLLRGISFNVRNVYIIISITFLFPTCYFTFKDIRFEYKWKEAYVSIQSGGLSGKELFQYEYLKDSWNGNPYFLYNYASELNYIGMYENSLTVFEICEKHLNDYAVQMQIADNYYQLGIWYEAESRYLKALAMCPNRFLPLQGLLRTYDKSEKYSDANDVALAIMNKEIKVPSYTVSLIKAEAEIYLKNNSYSFQYYIK